MSGISREEYNAARRNYLQRLADRGDLLREICTRLDELEEKNRRDEEYEQEQLEHNEE